MRLIGLAMSVLIRSHLALDVMSLFNIHPSDARLFESMESIVQKITFYDLFDSDENFEIGQIDDKGNSSYQTNSLETNNSSEATN